MHQCNGVSHRCFYPFFLFRLCVQVDKTNRFSVPQWHVVLRLQSKRIQSEAEFTTTTVGTLHYFIQWRNSIFGKPFTVHKGHRASTSGDSRRNFESMFLALIVLRNSCEHSFYQELCWTFVDRNLTHHANEINKLIKFKSSPLLLQSVIKCDKKRAKRRNKNQYLGVVSMHYIHTRSYKC